MKVCQKLKPPAGRPRAREGCVISMPIQIAPEPSVRQEDGKIDEWELICRSPTNATAADLRNLTLQAMRLLLSGDMHARARWPNRTTAKPTDQIPIP
jgi:hypothetical protein